MFWTTFRDSSILDRIEDNAASRRVRFLPSRSFATAPFEQRGLRLGHASLTPEEAIDAVHRLAQAAGDLVRPEGSTAF